MSVEVFTVLIHMPRETGAEVQTSVWCLPPVLPVGSWVSGWGSVSLPEGIFSLSVFLRSWRARGRRVPLTQELLLYSV